MDELDRSKVGETFEVLALEAPRGENMGVKIAIENGHRNSGFSHEKWRFSIAMLNYQRVPKSWGYDPRNVEECRPTRVVLTIFKQSFTRVS